MIDYDMTINRTNILSMTTARADRIYLPYTNTGGVCYYVGQMLADHIGQTREYPDTPTGDRQLSKDTTAMLDHSKISTCLVLQPSRIQPRAGLAINVTTPDGQRLHQMIYVPNGNDIAAGIVSKFLKAGAPGLRDDVRRSYEHQHSVFLKRRQGKREAA